MLIRQNEAEKYYTCSHGLKKNQSNKQQTKKPCSVSPVNLRILVDKHYHWEVLPLVTLQRQPMEKWWQRWCGKTWDSDSVAGLNCRESSPNPKNSEVILQFVVLDASHSLCPAGKECLFFVVSLPSSPPTPQNQVLLSGIHLAEEQDFSRLLDCCTNTGCLCCFG